MPVSAPRTELDDALAACRSYLLAAGGFSFAINLLYLASPISMLQVYNRVVSSGSQVTLVLLTAILLSAFAALAALDGVRARILSRMGVKLDRLLADKVLSAAFRSPGGNRAQALRDFDTFRHFVSSPSLSALLDLPWVPLYVAAAFLLHPVLGWFTLGASVILLALAVANEFLQSRALREAGEAAGKSQSFIEMSLRNAEVVSAMGMLPGLLARWRQDRNLVILKQTQAADRAGSVGGAIRFLRLSMQSLALGLGALLAIEQLVSLGAMFAATFLLGRAVQPIEQIVGSWRNIVSARAAYRRLKELFDQSPPADARLSLPRPDGALAVEGLHYALPKTTRLVLRQIGFVLSPGEALGIIGPSGAGKSTLARLLVGVLKPSQGAVRLDGADIRNWPEAEVGRHIGYLPQDIELFADSVAANISRFQSGMDAEVIRAAEMAGVHDMIQRLPDGYNTQVGEGGAVLSGGYRQRIGLARAVFGRPSLVVLDEPSSNLDADGDAALTDCLASLKAMGTTVVIVSHRPGSLARVDRILVLRDGAMDALGPRDDIAARLMRTERPLPKVANG
ncbi:MAG: type I secretion system permease/ATPase [Devosia sp.]